MSYQCKLVLFFLVSSFGLLSCDQDKIQEKTDSWKLEQPSIKSQKAPSKILKLNLLKKDLKTDDEILFYETERSVSLRVVTTCIQPRNSQFAIEFSEIPKRLTVLSLLPPEVLFDPEAKPSTPIICSFSFKARNTHNSTHSFELLQKRILQSPSSSGLDVRRHSQKLNEMELTEKPLPYIDFADYWLSGDEVEADTLVLFCDQFTSEIPWNNSRISIAYNKIGWKDSSLGSFPIQKCRFVTRYQRQTTGLSPYFYVKFPAAQLNVTWKAVGPNSYKAALGYQTLWQLRIHNPNKFPTNLILHPPQQATLRFDIAHMDGQRWLRVTDFQIGIDSGHQRPEPMWFTMAPNQTRTIQIGALLDYSCQFSVLNRIVGIDQAYGPTTIPEAGYGIIYTGDAWTLTQVADMERPENPDWFLDQRTTKPKKQLWVFNRNGKPVVRKAPVPDFAKIAQGQASNCGL